MMKTSILMFTAALALLGCGSPDVETTPPPACPASGCPNASCLGAPDGAKCLGFTSSEQRGWAGFCVASTCTEYVPVKCALTAPSMTVIGCDGSGMVTSGYEIRFAYQGSGVTCSGVDGEFGYCATGTTCNVYQSGSLIGIGVCK